MGNFSGARRRPQGCAELMSPGVGTAGGALMATLDTRNAWIGQPVSVTLSEDLTRRPLRLPTLPRLDL